MTLCYNTVIACLARGRRKEAAEAARGILDRTRASYAAGDIGERPDTVTYGAAMSAWARSGREDAADRAQQERGPDLRCGGRGTV